MSFFFVDPMHIHTHINYFWNSHANAWMPKSNKEKKFVYYHFIVDNFIQRQFKHAMYTPCNDQQSTKMHNNENAILKEKLFGIIKFI